MDATSTTFAGLHEPVQNSGLDHQGGSFDPAPALSNTGALSSQSVSGGVDFFEVSAWCHWALEVFDELTGRLEAAQKAAQIARENGNQEPHLVELDGGELVEVLPHGVGKGIRCRLAIRFRGITIGLTGKREFGPSRPNVRVYVTSDTLMVLGHVGAWDAAVSLLRGVGASVERTTVSRLDVCADLPGVKVDQFVGDYEAGKYIARARKSSVYRDGRRVTGFTIGAGVVLRVYDKLVEAARNPDKLDIMVQRRWGGSVPDDGATRVEFQLRGEHLKENIVADNSVENVFASLAKVCEWCTEAWFRMTDRVVDHENKNHSRAELSALWRDTIAAFKSWCGESAESLMKPVKRSSTNTKALIQQGVGCLAAAVSRVGSSQAQSLETFMAVIEKRLAEVSEYAYRSYQRKVREVDTGTAIGPEIDLNLVPF